MIAISIFLFSNIIIISNLKSFYNFESFGEVKKKCEKEMGQTLICAYMEFLQQKFQ